MPQKKIPISGAEVQRMAREGSKVTEIAEYFGVHRDTIHGRFSAELRMGRVELKTSLRKLQLRSAKQGNTGMLALLGRVYLGQSDKTLDEHILEAIDDAGLDQEDLLQMIKDRDAARALAPKKTFFEFCETAGYPIPYPKQVEMMEFGMHEEVTRLLLGARGTGKTDIVVIMGLGYQIYLHPDTESNLVITKSKDRNTAMLREIQEACEKNGVVFAITNTTTLRTAQCFGKDSTVSAVTLKGTSLRGRHPKRVIMDDPVTEDDTAEASRLLAKKKYNEIMKLVQNVLIIGQPAHQYDLYADLRGIVKTMEVPHGSIPELDHDLEAQRLAGVDEASISASYYLKVLSEGTSPFNAVKLIDRFPTGEAAVAFIDPSEGGDYTAVTILKAYMEGVAAIGFVYKRAWNHCLDDLTPHLLKHNVKKLCFETNCTGDMPIELLRKLWPSIGVVGHRANSNKHARIMAAGAFAHMIHLAKESDKLYLDHVVKYEYKAKFDDAPDSLASCLEWIGLIRGKR